MEGFLKFLSNNELTIVICLMVLIFGLIMTIIIIDIYSRRINRKVIDNSYDEQLDNLDTDINESGLGMVADSSALDSIDVETVTKNLEKTQEIEEIKYVEEDEDLEKTKALLELESIKLELSKMENQEYLDVEPEVVHEYVDDNPVNLENVEQIETPKIEEPIMPVVNEVNSSTIFDEVNKFESDQEEHAIISVEELTKASMEITDEEIEAYEDDGNEPISIKELEEMYKPAVEPVTEQKEEKITLPDFDIKVKPAIDVYEDKNFKNTPVISPVFGLSPSESNVSLEHTANLDKLNDEIKKTNEFLSMIKELRKNLD